MKYNKNTEALNPKAQKVTLGMKNKNKILKRLKRKYIINIQYQ